MPPGKAGTPITLHQPRSGMTVAVEGGLHADVAGAFLHDDAEDDALLDAELGAFEHGVPDGADVRAGVARGEHGGLVGVEDFFEGFPLAHGGEGGGGAGEGGESHGEV